MANNDNLKPFKKGHAGGPGRPANPPELKAIRQMTKGEFILLNHKLLDLSLEELENFKGTVLEMAMAAIIKKAIENGDQFRLQFFVERLYGKVTDKIELTDKSTYGEKLNRFKKRGK